MFKNKIIEFLWQEKHIRDRMCRIGNTDRSGKCPDRIHETSQKKNLDGGIFWNLKKKT